MYACLYFFKEKDGVLPRAKMHYRSKGECKEYIHAPRPNPTTPTPLLWAKASCSLLPHPCVLVPFSSGITILASHMLAAAGKYSMICKECCVPTDLSLFACWFCRHFKEYPKFTWWQTKAGAGHWEFEKCSYVSFWSVWVLYLYNHLCFLFPRVAGCRTVPFVWRKLYSKPVWMILTFMQRCRVTSKLELLQVFCRKVTWSRQNFCDDWLHKGPVIILD